MFSKVEGGDELYQLLCGIFNVREDQNLKRTHKHFIDFIERRRARWKFSDNRLYRVLHRIYCELCPRRVYCERYKKEVAK